MSTMMMAVILLGAAAYLSLIALAVVLWIMVSGQRVELKDLREQNTRYADRIAHAYPVPPPRRPGPTVDPDPLQPNSSYFTRRKGW